MSRITEIEQMRDAFFNAHRATSFSPEKRADSCVEGFSTELSSDLHELGSNTGKYKEKYLAHLRKWTAAKARTMSPMITGSANFPAERNRKAFERERRAWEEFQEWRERYFKRASRVPTKTPEEEIDEALIRLEKERNAHTLMIEANKIHRRKVSDEEKKKAFSEELELAPELIEKMLEPDCYGRKEFASYSLTNSNARIKNLERKLLVMKSRIERRDNFEKIEFPGGYINIENDRVVIRHEEKPPREVIESIKGSGFRWSPHWKCWCRKHTANALKAAKTVCKVNT